MSQVRSEEDVDLTVVDKDGSTLVVQAKSIDGRTVRYGMPRTMLDVVFTGEGIVATSADSDHSTPAEVDSGTSPHVHVPFKKAGVRR